MLTDEKLKIIRQATDYSVEVDTGRTALLPRQREIQKHCNHSAKQINWGGKKKAFSLKHRISRVRDRGVQELFLNTSNHKASILSIQ